MRFLIKKSDSGLILREYLNHNLKFSSRFIKRLTRKRGYLLINNQAVTVRYVLRANDVLQINLPEEKRSPSIKPKHIPLQIVYEDDWLIVINKTAGMPSIPSSLYRNETVANGLLAYYDKCNLPYTIHIVTRLDKDTSGLMLVAKHQYSHSLLSQMQKKRQINRYYEAIVSGLVAEEKGSISEPIRRKEGSIIEREVGSNGQCAITHFHVVKRYAEYTHVEIELETGRTHQIRVHFQSIGHPLLGDGLYGGDRGIINRQALHCAKIKFKHPVTGESLLFEADKPGDIKSLL